MIPVLTKEQAYKLDNDTIESGHLSQEELMDNAGKAVAQFFCEKIKDPFNQKVVVVCGKGNNGGDGVIAHSYLIKYNVSSKIVFTKEKHGHSNLIKKYKISKRDSAISLVDGGTVHGQLIVSGLGTAGADPSVAGQLFITSSKQVVAAGDQTTVETGSAYIVLASQG